MPARQPRTTPKAAATPQLPPTARAVLDAAMDEKTLRKAVTDLLTKFNWCWSYIPDSRMMRGMPGIPDLVAVRYGRVLFIELKTERGRISHDQRIWLDALRCAATVEVFIWRPHHMPDIERILA